MRTIARLGARVLVAGLAFASARANPSVTADQVFDVLGFDAGQRARVRAGEIVTRGFEERSDKQLAVAMAMIAHTPMERLIADLRSGGMLEHDRALLSYGEIHEPASAAQDLAGLHGPTEEIDAFFAAHAGSRFNLSIEEYGRLDALRRRFPGVACSKTPACADAVTEAYRGFLAERCAAYREHGLDGIAPYAREGGKASDPAAELRVAAEGLRLMTEGTGRLLQAFIDYPQGDASAFEHQYFWLEQSIQDRRTPILSHRLLHVEPGAAFLAERQFYVGHSYNALQVLAGLMPIEGSTLVFYLNRTSTDQVAGALSPLRHDAGRRLMAKEIRAHFEQLRGDPGAR